MTGESVSKRKLTFLIFFLTYCGQSHMYTPDSQVMNISEISEQISNTTDLTQNIFLSNDSNSDNFDNIKYNMVKCINELDLMMANPLNFNIWQAKLWASWGRMPSGFLSGNIYDFGDFHRCFNLDRDKKSYPTQYCLAEIIFDMTESMTPEYLEKNAELETLTQLIEFREETKIMKKLLTQQTTTDAGLNIGICLPDICSPLMIAHEFSNLFTELNVSIIQIGIPEDKCQFEEKITQIDTLDVVAIVLLVIVICLMILSTWYDFRCTLNNLPKSQTMTAFSVSTNGMKLFSFKTDKIEGRLPCLDGIRAINTLWVVLCHNFVLTPAYPVMNAYDAKLFFDTYSSMIILNGVLAVDTFLLLSGILISITLLRELEKTKRCTNIPMLYIHRYLRLTPMLAITILYTITLLRFLGNGPLWTDSMAGLRGPCLRNWWTSLLYVQNYLNGDDICLYHTWYLSIDTQLFILAPFLIQLIYRFKFKAIFGLSISIFVCIGYTIATYMDNDLIQTGNILDRFLLTILPTHMRFMPWLIGIFLGYILHEMRNKKIRISTLVNLTGWMISFLLLIIVSFTNHSMLQSLKFTSNDGYYDSFARVAWPIAIGYIIFACVYNYGGPVNLFLSHPFWQPISNLSYSIYLVHFPVKIMFQAAMKSVPYFSLPVLNHSFHANCIISILVSVFMCLAFEAPLKIIQNVIFGNKVQKQKDSDSTLNVSQEN